MYVRKLEIIRITLKNDAKPLVFQDNSSQKY